MRSEDQKQASRINGARSNGPKTEDGKARSAQNGNRHNLSGGHLVLLSTEDPFEFARHREDYIARFQPADGVELDLVERMIAASWREKRVAHMEAALVELEIERMRPDIEEEFIEIDNPARQMLAMLGTSSQQTASALLVRYHGSAVRAFRSAFRILRDLQGDRFNRKPAAPPIQPASSASPQPGPPPASTPEPPSLATGDARRAIKLITVRLRNRRNIGLRSEPGNVRAAAA